MVQRPHSGNRIALQAAARRLGLTGQGLLKLLKRADAAVRDNGRWYVPADKLEAIAAARRTLGIDRATKGRGADSPRP